MKVVIVGAGSASLAAEYMYMPSVEGALRSGIDAAEAALRD
jgi:hypothetical protein